MSPIKIFDALLTAGAAVGLTATAFFVMLAGYQYLNPLVGLLMILIYIA